ncbi:SidA/IucD/PvdA family monooxygenase [Bacillus shivajii]|uniref:lysine N(6)-hydroxylase/L-ornithine N(5)-oxygenase family protein n=1 Tax=Bacillus shivajii TaxID=1983719 RepID=UPI001CF9A669|nr:SidA/IucD/PvdA family monooxygenase [Bacillus shivajii]UCZ54041.1 SidA/IucD/PvdA family monooxygenase [Bacillus shivajii]
MGKNEIMYDVIGIGIGPFNLGMAALLEDEDKVNAMFFDETPVFNWHPGMLIEGADLQVPFLADFVTFADPTSRFSFLNYLHEQNRLYQFYFFNRFDIPRREYNDYAQWVASQLTNCMFSSRVVDVIDHDTYYDVVVEDQESGEKRTYATKHLVLGTGSSPLIPKGLRGFPKKDVLHTSNYQYEQPELEEAEGLMVVGSGQSAAEVFLDLLQKQNGNDQHIYWVTRSAAFFQLESGKLGQEVFSPDYIDYYHSLPYDKRMNEIPHLQHLRQGVEEKTLHEIYDLLYHKTVNGFDTGVTILTSSDVKKIEQTGNKYTVTCEQWQQEKEYSIDVNKVILATGYRPNIPDWFEKFNDKIEWEENKHFKVKRDYRLSFKEPRDHHFFTLTNIEHSHGASATNLGLAVQRNVTIINKIAGRELYPEQRNTVFQNFGALEE